MVLSIQKMSLENEGYFLRMVRYFLGRRNLRPVGAEGQPEDRLSQPMMIELTDPEYLSIPGELPGRWYGLGAEQLGLAGIIEETPYVRLFRGFHPVTGNPLVQNAGRQGRVPCWDLCFSPPKAFSILWTQLPSDLRAKLQWIHWRAVQDTLDFLQARFAYSRKGKASEGLQFVFVQLVFALHEHVVSRALDPALHLHCQVINLGIDSQGHHRSVHSQPIYDNKMLLGAYYHAQLAHRMRTEMGIKAEVQGRSFTIPGIPEELILAHSKRRQKILQLLAKWHRTDAVAAADAAVATRQSKDKLISRQEVLKRSQAVNVAHGFGERQAIALTHEGGLATEGSIPAAIRKAIELATEKQNHFTHKDLVLHTLWQLPQFGLSPETVLDEVDNYLKSPSGLVCLSGVGEAPRYTTQAILKTERRLFGILDQLHFQSGNTVSEANFRKVLAANPSLRKGQIDLVKHLTQTPSALAIAVGPAGSGKTHVTRAAVEAWEKQGFDVVLTSVTGKASRLLAEATGRDCMTVTKTFADYRLSTKAAFAHHSRHLWRAICGRKTWSFRQPQPVALTDRSIVLVDEASMLNVRQLQLIAQHVAAAGASLRLLGDARQLPPVVGVSAMPAACRRYGAAKLRRIVRQKQKWARVAARKFAQGKVAEGLAMYIEQDLVNVQPNEPDAICRACSDWQEEAVRTPQKAIVLANTNEAVEMANRLCQKHRIARKCISTDVLCQIVDEQPDACFESRAYVGDRVLFTRNSTSYGVENGTLGTIVRIDSFRNVLHVVLDDGRNTAVDARKFPHIRLGYAMSVYRSQGASIPRVYSIVGGAMQNAPASYVQATRGIERTQFYTTKEFLDPRLKEIADSELVRQMSRKPEDRFASELLEKAGGDVSQLTGQSTKGLFSPTPKRTSQPSKKKARNTPRRTTKQHAVPPKRQPLAIPVVPSDHGKRAAKTPVTPSPGAKSPAARAPAVPAPPAGAPPRRTNVPAQPLPIPAPEPSPTKLGPAPRTISPPIIIPSHPTVSASASVSSTSRSTPAQSTTTPSVARQAQSPRPNQFTHSSVTPPFLGNPPTAAKSCSPPSIPIAHTAASSTSPPPITTTSSAAFSSSASPSARYSDFQRLRVGAGEYMVRDGYLLQASCVDGGTRNGRDRPPPDHGIAMPFASQSIQVRRRMPAPSGPMSLGEAQAAGLLTLRGTGSEDYVQVQGRPHETWLITVQDSLGLLSAQPDIKDGVDSYSDPLAIDQLQVLDQWEQKLRNLMPGPGMLMWLFAICRREASWLLPQATDPASVPREFLERFYQMLFRDPEPRAMFNLFARLLRPLEELHTQHVLEDSLPRSLRPPRPEHMRHLSQCLLDGRDYDAAVKAILASLIAENGLSGSQVQSLPEQLAPLFRTVVEQASLQAQQKPSADMQRRLLELAGPFLGTPVTQVHPVSEILWSSTRLTSGLLHSFAPARILHRYCKCYLTGDFANARAAYQPLAAAMGG